MSGEVIIIKAEDVWGVFNAEKLKLRTQLKKIAEHSEYGIIIYLTEEDGLPQVTVYNDDIELYSEQCISESDTERTVKKIYAEYLTDKIISRVGGGYYEDDDEDDLEDKYGRFDQDMEIEEREEEIDLALEDFFLTIFGEPLEGLVDDADLIYEDVKDHFLEYLYRKWGLEIRRPMYLEDDKGDEFFEEYPYECMEFEDEDNPIYK